MCVNNNHWNLVLNEQIICAFHDNYHWTDNQQSNACATMAYPTHNKNHNQIIILNLQLIYPTHNKNHNQVIILNLQLIFLGLEVMNS